MQCLVDSSQSMSRLGDLSLAGNNEIKNGLFVVQLGLSPVSKKRCFFRCFKQIVYLSVDLLLVGFFHLPRQIKSVIF